MSACSQQVQHLLCAKAKCAEFAEGHATEAVKCSDTSSLTLIRTHRCNAATCSLSTALCAGLKAYAKAECAGLKVYVKANCARLQLHALWYTLTHKCRTTQVHP